MQQIQHCPYPPEPKKYGADAQSPLPSNNPQKLTDSEIKQVQKIVGSIFYYARAVDMTVLIELSTIVSKQTKGTERTLEKAHQVLDYLATHHDATVQCCASNLGMKIPLDMLCLSKPNAHSRACGIFFHGILTNCWETHQT